MNTKSIFWVGIAIVSVGLAIMDARAQNSSLDTQVPQPTQVPPDANQVPPNGTQPPVLVPTGQPVPGAPAPAAAQPPDSSTVPPVTGTTTPVGPPVGNTNPVPAPAPSQVLAPAPSQVLAPTPSQVPAPAPSQVPAPAPSQVPAPAPSQVAAPNSGAAPDYLQRDQAITPEDQGMLAQMRQAVFPQGPTEAWMGSVHFILKEGAVRLVGTVPSLQERQRIEQVVSQIPNVTRVYDALIVNPSAAVAATTTNGVPGATPAPVPAPTSHPVTNADGTVVPNPAGPNTIYETAPPQQQLPR